MDISAARTGSPSHRSSAASPPSADRPPPPAPRTAAGGGRTSRAAHATPRTGHVRAVSRARRTTDVARALGQQSGTRVGVGARCCDDFVSHQRNAHPRTHTLRAPERPQQTVRSRGDALAEPRHNGRPQRQVRRPCELCIERSRESRASAGSRESASTHALTAPTTCEVHCADDSARSEGNTGGGSAAPGSVRLALATRRSPDAASGSTAKSKATRSWCHQRLRGAPAASSEWPHTTPRSVSACRRGGPELAERHRAAPPLSCWQSAAPPRSLSTFLASLPPQATAGAACAPPRTPPRAPLRHPRRLAAASACTAQRPPPPPAPAALGTQLTLNLTANALCQVLLAFKESFIPVSQCNLNPGLQADTSAPHGGRRACARPPPLPLFPSHSRARVLPSPSLPLFRARWRVRGRAGGRARARRRSGGRGDARARGRVRFCLWRATRAGRRLRMCLTGGDNADEFDMLMDVNMAAFMELEAKLERPLAEEVMRRATKAAAAAGGATGASRRRRSARARRALRVDRVRGEPRRWESAHAGSTSTSSVGAANLSTTPRPRYHTRSPLKPPHARARTPCDDLHPEYVASPSTWVPRGSPTRQPTRCSCALIAKTSFSA